MSESIARLALVGNPNSGKIFDNGMNRIRTGPGTSAVPKPAMPNTM